MTVRSTYPVHRFVWKPGIETVEATIDYAIQIGRISTKESGFGWTVDWRQ